MLHLFKTLIRPHLNYSGISDFNTAVVYEDWSVFIHYKGKLDELGLFSLEHKRRRGNLTEIVKS